MKKEILLPADTLRIAPELGDSVSPDVWVYRYTHPSHGWVLSVATHAEPGSGKLSLGGFRIAPADRVARAGYDNDREAIGLAIGMEDKVYWSRLIRAGGPLALRDTGRLVGGKCVLLPSDGARIGEPKDFELLNFAIEALRDIESSAGVHITTGQDLGHGVMSDGSTHSLAYLNSGFPGSVQADTSKPTGEGNFQLLKGVLRALDVPLAGSRIGIIGCGNIGEHVLTRLVEHGADALVLESSPARRARVEALGVGAWEPERKEEFLRQPLDALAVNALGGSLDARAVELTAANEHIRAVTGCENLVMADPSGVEMLRRGGTVFCPTEFGGMMGYLTAVEEYLSLLEGVSFDIVKMFPAAERLDTAGYEATEHVKRSGHALTFEEAVREVYQEQGLEARP